MSEVEVVSDSREVADQSSRSSKKRAKVWEYVETELVDGKEKAVCRYCKLHLSNELGKGTSHLNRHIGFHCMEILQEDRARFLKTLKKSGEEEIIFDPDVFRTLIAKFFISAEIVFRKANDPYWKKLMSYCHPSFRAVGRVSCHPTAHLFLKLVLAIRDVLLDETWNFDELLNAMANAMYSKFEKYWAEPNIVLLIAVVLDPSLKMDFLRFYFYTINENVEEKLRDLRTCMKKFYGAYEIAARQDNLSVATPSDQIMVADVSGFGSSRGPLLGKRRVELAFAQFASQRSDSSL